MALLSCADTARYLPILHARLVLWLSSSPACCCILQCHVCALLMAFSPWPWCMLKSATRVFTDTDTVSTAYSLLACLRRWLKRQRLFVYMAQWLFSAICCVPSQKAIRCHFMPCHTGSNKLLPELRAFPCPCFTQVNIGVRQSIRNCMVKSLDYRNLSEFPGHSAYLVFVLYQTELFWSAEKWNLW